MKIIYKDLLIFAKLFNGFQASKFICYVMKVKSVDHIFYRGGEGSCTSLVSTAA